MVATSTCPECGKRLQVEERLVGRRCRCPACGTAFTVTTMAFPGPASIAPSLEASETLNRPADTNHCLEGESATEREGLLGSLGRFEVRAVLGQGGFGTVYRAYDPVLERDVALKVPKFTAEQERKVARFLREAKAAARLNHPNIATIYDAGEEEGSPYFVMEYVAGTDLGTLVRNGGPLPVDVAVNYVIQTARGLEHAHNHGTIHRDIKPSNLMLDAEGTVKILDMGLARVARAADEGEDSDHSLTRRGQMMGTVDYMAPEQAEDARSADQRADIYSLGCTLWMLLTGRAIYESESLVGRIVAHRESAIPSLASHCPAVPARLDAVLKRMVAKNAEERFATMSEVIQQLEACLADDASTPEPTPSPFEDFPAISGTPRPTRRARSETRLRSLVPTRRRTRWLVAIGAGLLTLGLVGITLAVVLRLRTSEGTLVVEVNEPDAQVEIDGGKIKITTPDSPEPVEFQVAEGKHTLRVTKNGFETFTSSFTMRSRGKDTVRVELQPIKAPPAKPVKPVEPKSVDIPELVPWLEFSAPGTEGLIFWEDHDHLATATQDDASGGVHIWTLVPTPSSVERGRFPSGFRALSASPRGRQLALGSKDGSVRFWDLDKPESARVLGSVAPHEAGTAVFSPDGSRVLATGNLLGRIKIWDVASGGETLDLPLVQSPTAENGPNQFNWQNAVVFSPDGTMIAGPAAGNDVKLWDSTSGTERRSLSWEFDAYATGVSFSPDGKRLAITSQIGGLRIWDLQADRLVADVHGADGPACCSAFSRGGRLVLSSGGDDTVRLWDAASGDLLALLRSGSGTGIPRAAFSPDDTRVAAVSWDGKIRVWEIGDLSRKSTSEDTHAAEYSSSGELIQASTRWNDLLPLVNPNRDAVVGRWQMRDGQLHVTETPELYNRMEIPVIPLGSYEFRVEFTRQSGEGDVSVLLPVRWGAAAIVLRNRPGEPTALYDVQEQHRAGQDATRPPELTNGEPHTVQVRVRLEGKDDQADIQMFFDGVPTLAWRGPQKALTTSVPYRMLRTETLGVGSQGTVIFHAAELRMLDGSARRYSPPRGEWDDPVDTIRARGGDVETDAQGQVVRVSLSRVADRELEHLAKLLRMKSLSINGDCPVSSLGIPQLAQLSALEELNLTFCAIDDSALPYIARLGNLSILILHGTRVSDTGLVHLKTLGKLNTLHIGWTRVTDDGLATLEGFPSLRYLNMAFLDVGDVGAEHLARLAGLEELHFLGAPRLTDKGIERLTSLTNIRCLGLGSTGITDSGLKCLAKFPKLDALNVGGCEIGDDGLQHLAGLKLTDVDLCHTRITSAGLRHLRSLNGLRVLRLRETRIDDAAIEHLIPLNGLNTLELNGTAFTAAGVAKLRSSLPSCTISVDPQIEEQLQSK